MGGEIARDLFGGLREMPSGKRGRPSHCWSQENENRVLIGMAMQYSDAEIASGLCISVPTLRKHYFSTLKRREMQRTRFELWRAEVLAGLANDGNVGAMKELSKIVERRDRHLAEEKLRHTPEVHRAGKKQLAALQSSDAERALDQQLGLEALNIVRQH